MLDLVLEGNAYLDGALNKCCVGIENGKIVAIKKILKGDQHFDFGDKLLLPAGIDAHVHFRDPGYTYKEDFKSGTEAAAFGGIGCVLDMPNTKPPVVSKTAVQEKLAIVSKKSHVDFGLFSSIGAKTNIIRTARECTAFKIYLASTTGELLFTNHRILGDVVNTITGLEKLVAFHAENEAIIQNQSRLNSQPKNLHDHLLNRPNEAEASEIEKIIGLLINYQLKQRKKKATLPELLKLTSEISDMTDKAGAVVNNTNKEITQASPINERTKPDTAHTQSSRNHVHICHLSTIEGLNLVREYKNRTKQVEKTTLTKPSNVLFQLTAEVTPHHLLLNERFSGGTMGKVNPPLRTIEDQNALWSGLLDGTIDMIASDHAPHTLDEKQQEFSLAPSGLPGVETMLPLMLSKMKHNMIPLGVLVSTMMERPARLFGLPKGRLAEGYDADIIVIDFFKEGTVKTRNLHSKCNWTPYEGMDSVFPLLLTVRGNIIIKNENLESGAGTGKYYK